MIKRKKRIIMYMTIVLMMIIGMGKIGDIALAENQDSVEEQNNDISAAGDEEEKIESDFIFEVSGEEATLTRYNGSDANVTIPEIFIDDDIEYTVTSIGEKAFFECSSLTTIEFPSSIESIEGSAFYYCINLTSVNLSETLVRSIGVEAFYYCENLKTIELSDSLETIGETAFAGCEKLETIEIPDSVTRIGKYAFDNCRSLEKIKIPDLVKSIEPKTFFCCYNLKSIKFPDSLESIGIYAMCHCPITTVALPNTLINLDSKAFGDRQSPSSVRNLIFICQGIDKMEIEESVVNSIGEIMNVYSDFKVYRMAADIEISTDYNEIESYEFVGKSVELTGMFDIRNNGSIVYDGTEGNDLSTNPDINAGDYIDTSVIKYNLVGSKTSLDTRIENNTLYIGEDETSENLKLEVVNGITRKTMPIHIVRAKSISIKEEPTKSLYNEGDEYEPDGLVITLTYTDGKETDIIYSEDNPDFNFEVNEELIFETTEQVIRYKNDRLEVTHPLTVYGNRTLSGTNVQLTGKFNKSSQLKIGKVSEDSKIYEGLSNKKIIAEYDIDVIGGYDGDCFEIEFELENELNGKKVSIRHLKQDGNIEEFEETVSEGKTAIEVTELSPFVIYTEKEIIEEPETPIIPKPDVPDDITPDIPNEPDIKPNEPTPDIPIIGPSDLNQPIQTKPSQNQPLHTTVSTEDKQNILLWGVLGIIGMSVAIMLYRRKAEK